MLIPPASLCVLSEQRIIRVDMGHGLHADKSPVKRWGVRILLSMLGWGSGGLGCRSQACAVACVAYCGSSEVFCAVLRLGIARVGGVTRSWSREIEMGSVLRKCDQRHHFAASVFLLVKYV